MTVPPMPGPKGKELMETVSQEAWESWKSHQTTLINEKHLDMSKADDRLWLIEQMEKFFNNEDVEHAFLRSFSNSTGDDSITQPLRRHKQTNNYTTYDTDVYSAE